MITEAEYLKALEVVITYREQIIKQVSEALDTNTDVKIEDAGFSVRCRNVLREYINNGVMNKLNIHKGLLEDKVVNERFITERNNIKTLRQLYDIWDIHEAMKVRNFGNRSLIEIEEAFLKLGLNINKTNS